MGFLAFVDDAAKGRILDLLAMIQAPSSIGRFKQHPLGVFDPEGVAFVKSLGFDVDPT